MGISLNAGFGQRTSGRIFVEKGHETYTAFSPATPARREDVSSFGAALTVALHRGLTVGVQGLRSRFDSNLPGGDRTYASVGVTVNLVGFQ